MTKREIKAVAYNLADEILTRAQPLIDKGMDRDRAIMITVALMNGKIQIVHG